MTIVLGFIAVLTLGTAIFAVTRRSLIHAALALVLTWFGIAAFYLWAGAEFIAFAQVLLYAGAISMVVLFAVLLTRPTLDAEARPPISKRRAGSAVAVGAAVAAVLAYAILHSPVAPASAAPPSAPVRAIGLELMGPQVAALLIGAVLLTAALIGAIVIAAAPKPNVEEKP